MKIGDNVNYVPAECHALIEDSRGEYPWVVGHKDRAGVVRELSDAELVVKIKTMRRQGSSMVKEHLELVRPKTLWPAVVVGIDGDKVSLDVDQPNSPITHHVTVPVDPTGKTPHSCHEIKPKVAVHPAVPVPEPTAPTAEAAEPTAAPRPAKK